MKWYKYNIDTMTLAEYNRWYSLMSDEKKKRTDLLISEISKKQSVAGDMLARKSISKTLGIEYSSIKFRRTDNGKPYAEDLNVSFNISHSGKLVVCAIDENNIGIDVEQIRPINLAIAKRMFTDEEIYYIFKKTPVTEDFSYTDNKNILHRFYEIWTLKEAYCKWSGDGISAMNSVDFNMVNKESHLEDDYYISIVYNK